MRVKKQFGTTNYLDPCLATGFGQAEDYSVNVSAGGGGNVLDTAYGINNSNQDVIGFNVADPLNTEVFATSPVTVNFENAGAIDPNNPTTGYSLDNGGDLYSFDISTGFYTFIGNIPGSWLGMEYDQNSGILYAITGTELYTIDTTAISATLVGPLGFDGVTQVPIALAINGSGVGYTYDIGNDTLYTVDLTNGATTAVGLIGFDASFGQGMCYDALTDTVYMAAFNATTFQAEWRSVNTTTGMSTLIGPIVTDEATTQVGWVSIGETLPMPTCLEPTNLAVSNITENTVDLSWDAEPNATNGYIWYVMNQGENPITGSPVDTGTTPAGTITATASGLTNATLYDFYVVADCDGDGLSRFAGPVEFATLVTPPACDGKFFDTGGPGANYQNDEMVTTTIVPDNPGDAVTVTFTAFNVEDTWDALYVYDGPDATFPLISSGNPATQSGFPAGGYYGTSIPGPFTSSDSSGALTFVFMSDNTVTTAGWEADVTCDVLGISDNALAGFAYFPNPTSNILSLKSVNNIEAVSMFSILGQKVMDLNIGATTSDINLSGLQSGTYIMKVTVDGQTGTFRVLKN
ncbi:T9SS type A sorting domain-containing protein [Aequorivita echinoideorum]|uniref:T9SS type A sorting domain-containing protein n=2 Tax=Aequorivita echinoideorum TaxID=1549647 RepID=A0ABS5S5V6_9FLAO|nr:T9SS type A sorting domain-containing protein [Aequorivita echinoideorum]